MSRRALPELRSRWLRANRLRSPKRFAPAFGSRTPPGPLRARLRRYVGARGPGCPFSRVGRTFGCPFSATSRVLKYVFFEEEREQGRVRHAARIRNAPTERGAFDEPAVRGRHAVLERKPLAIVL